MGIAFGAAITIAIKFWFLGIAGERLTQRLRAKVFSVLVRQEASYYDMPENSRGTLTSHLSSDAAAVRGILGDRLALMVQSVALIAGGCAVAFYFCPKIGAVVLGVSPMIALGGTCYVPRHRGEGGTQERRSLTLTLPVLPPFSRRAAIQAHDGL